MNHESQYTFNIYHFLLNLRDTLEFAMERDHGVTLYNQRKMVIKKGIEPGSAFGDFFRKK